MTKYILSFLLIVCLSGINAQTGKDKLGSLRTSKKIVSVNTLPASDDWAVQIIALKHPAGEPEFFKNIEQAREFRCADRFVRYTVGSYTNYQAAKNEVIYYKDLGYAQAFVVNTAKYNIGGAARSGFVPDPNKRYTIQLSAFRFPVYLNYFKGIENVKEFYLKDRVYRYTIGDYTYEDAMSELNDIKAKGYPKAFVTELDAYLPYQIE
ncbi:SPOR domain-containing protein [Saccharicrinis sp. GN24d3]|uniref:SPOR domain-containing protein n=1 Tax=Saccharicrinis sp. GN24d3 TaxID=3458416 RepID=UPI004035FD65